MTDDASPTDVQDPATGHVHLKLLRCRRTGQMLEVDAHAECPYCSGTAEAIRKTGQYRDFCEFHPGEDPLNFGFPADAERVRHG